MRNWNKIGRIVFSAGIFIWTLPILAKHLLQFPETFSAVLLNSGVAVEIIGFVIISQNGGFKRRIHK